ncbi:hypothetical protein BgiMline_007030 [Biomphalaria glabrata]
MRTGRCFGRHLDTRHRAWDRRLLWTTGEDILASTRSSSVSLRPLVRPNPSSNVVNQLLIVGDGVEEKEDGWVGGERNQGWGWGTDSFRESSMTSGGNETARTSFHLFARAYVCINFASRFLKNKKWPREITGKMFFGGKLSQL